MIRKLEKTDSEVVASVTGFDISKRDDINYDLSGISIDNDNKIESLIIIGKRPLSDYCHVGKIDKELGSQEILLYYSREKTDECMFKTFGPFVVQKLRNYSLCWYIPKDSNDESNAIKCLGLWKYEYKYKGVLIRRMR